MRVLVACEFSGVVRDAFLARGHDAVSADLLPSESGRGPHVVDDVRGLLRRRWDIVLSFPPCTYLCNSGVRWLYRPCGGRDEARWASLRRAARFFGECLAANAPRVVVENPVMHGHARALIGAGPTHTVQPWQFGDHESKRTCLWIRGLPNLRPIVEVRPDGVKTSVHRAPPSADRWRFRSRTFAGIAQAMADQWGIAT